MSTTTILPNSIVTPLSSIDDCRPLPTSQQPRYSIVIPVYNGWSLTQRALVSIADRTDAKRTPYEVIIADDHSKDATLDCETQFPGVRRVVNTSARSGFLHNCNFAAQEARGEIILLLNNDTEVQPGWLDAIDQTLEQSERIGIVGARLVYPDGRLQEAGCTVFPTAITRREGIDGDADDPQYLEQRCCDYVSGACLAIRTKLWQEIGGFDERYSPAYYEDVDLCFEAWQRDFEVVYQPDCLVLHVDGGSMASTRTQLAMNSRNKFRSKWQAVLELIKTSRPKNTTPFMYSGFVRKVWRALPLSGTMRSRIVSMVISPPKRKLAKLSRDGEPAPGRVTVAGYLQSALGIGEAARLELQALQELRFGPARLDVSPAFNMADLQGWGFGNTILTEGGPLLIRTNPLDLPRTLGFIGQPALKRRYLAGGWAWELSKPPAYCREMYSLLDELWVPSRFCADAFQPESPIPVHVVPHPVRVPPTSGKTRQAFGLPEDQVIFLAMADMRSSFARKNLTGAVEAFVEACGNRADTMLIIKTHHTQQSPENLARLEAAIGNAANVRVIDQLLSRGEVGDLLRVSDVVLSPHRSEGFGLVLAEGMLLGKPVIATNYSGNVDFMPPDTAALVDYELVPVHDPSQVYDFPDQVWAEPDKQQLSQHIADLAENTSQRQKLGESAQTHAASFFAPQRFYEQLPARFRELMVRFASR
ncbi:glycosyltransferase [Bremerella cremea]|uniref:glycosyltransferase n=1 Tax=Bremerella cremea TaxID=1031537 RepID=UPI0031ECF48E